MRELWRSRAPSVISVAALLLAILPFVALAAFAHPSSDDFCAANQMRDLGLWESQKRWYTQWSGRFVANVVMNAVPLAFGSLRAYKLTGVITILALFLAFFWVGREVLDRRIGTARVALLTLGLLAVYMNIMASPAEGLFWYTGVVIFTWGAIFALMAIASSLRSQGSHSAGGAWGWASVAGLCALLAAGSNEVVMLLLGLVLVVLSWLTFRVQVPRRRQWIVPLAITVLAGVADVLAPGNFKRAGVTGGLSDFVGPLIGSAAFSGAAVIEWASSGPVVLAGLAILACGIALSPELSPESPWRKTSWVVPCVAAVVGVWGAFLFTHWASGFAFRPGPPHRVTNVVLLFFLVIGTSATFMIGVQVLGRFHALAADLRPAGRWVLPAMAVMVFGQGNIREAYVDLLAGRAATYDAELDSRYAVLRAARERGEPAIVAPLSRMPKTIFFKDITPDPTDWRNQCLARYWGVAQVRVQP